jgi:hypothetical protein
MKRRPWPTRGCCAFGKKKFMRDAIKSDINEITGEYS